MPHVRRHQGNAGQHRGVLGSDPLEPLFSTRGWQGCGEKGASCTAGGDVRWFGTAHGEGSQASCPCTALPLSGPVIVPVFVSDPTALLTPGVPRVCEALPASLADCHSVCGPGSGTLGVSAMFPGENSREGNSAILLHTPTHPKHFVLRGCFPLPLWSSFAVECQ